MNLAKEDFYCGAFLSYLINSNAAPALFDDVQDSSRKIYNVSTDKEVNYTVYVKSCEKPSKSKNGMSNLWTFPFTEKQIDEILKISKNIQCEKFKFIFICGQERLNESTISVILFEELLQCIDIDRENRYKMQKVMIRLDKGQKAFRVYGTARDEKINRMDNTLRIKTNRIDSAFV